MKSLKKSTSTFNQKEEDRLLINVKAFNDFSAFRSYIKSNDDDLCRLMNSLAIEDVAALDDESLLTDIKNVIANCAEGISHNENYVDKLVENILRLSGFDSGLFFLDRPKRMRFMAGKNSFSSNADV